MKKPILVLSIVVLSISGCKTTNDLDLTEPPPLEAEYSGPAEIVEAPPALEAVSLPAPLPTPVQTPAKAPVKAKPAIRDRGDSGGAAALKPSDW